MSTKRWSAHLAKMSEAMDEVMREKDEAFEIDMQDAGADMNELAEWMALKRVEYAKWKANKLRDLEKWFERGGETLN